MIEAAPQLKPQGLDDDEGPIDFGDLSAKTEPEYDTDKDFAFRAQFIPVRLSIKVCSMFFFVKTEKLKLSSSLCFF